MVILLNIPDSFKLSEFRIYFYMLIMLNNEKISFKREIVNLELELYPNLTQVN